VHSVIEETRLRVSRATTAQTKSLLGQFFTPVRTARFMASLFTSTTANQCRLLDAGAGIGSLSSAFLQRCAAGALPLARVDLSVFEMDSALHDELTDSLSACGYTAGEHVAMRYELFGGDFIEAAVNRIQFRQDVDFTHAILNPPYKKISNDSRHRSLLRAVGIETVNLYSAFVALAVEMMADGGQIVAIIPRSFCNGPYYRPFREFLLQRCSIEQMHLFDSRNTAFKDDGVLQENVIIKLRRGASQGDVVVTTSTDDQFADIESRTYAFGQIVSSTDAERFIHIPTSEHSGASAMCAPLTHSLDDIGVTVSTGPVVDFRLREHLNDMPELGDVPLLYSGHFSGGKIEWPKPNFKKPNAIAHNADTAKWLFPNGHYCVVRRFSSKEERRRIVANIVDPKAFPDADKLGFENHLNVFHNKKTGLSPELAHGLGAFLNTTMIDTTFRRFSGHTQVNATDLRTMKYPSRDILIALGKWAMRQSSLSQQAVDEQLVIVMQP
jgi:adenine-specific DNA-methyltransferase